MLSSASYVLIIILSDILSVYSTPTFFILISIYFFIHNYFITTFTKYFCLIIINNF